MTYSIKLVYTFKGLPRLLSTKTLRVNTEYRDDKLCFDIKGLDYYISQKNILKVIEDESGVIELSKNLHKEVRLFCSKCDKFTTDTANFCRECGTILEKKIKYTWIDPVVKHCEDCFHFDGAKCNNMNSIMYHKLIRTPDTFSCKDITPHKEEKVSKASKSSKICVNCNAYDTAGALKGMGHCKNKDSPFSKDTVFGKGYCALFNKEKQDEKHCNCCIHFNGVKCINYDTNYYHSILSLDTFSCISFQKHKKKKQDGKQKKAVKTCLNCISFDNSILIGKYGVCRNKSSEVYRHIRHKEYKCDLFKSQA